MAQPTTQYPTTTQMARTPGVAQGPAAVGSMAPMRAGAVQTPETEGAKPVLFDDIEPILLARLYPEALAGGMAEARALAMAAGEAAFEQGNKLVASAQEPVAGELPAPPPPYEPPQEGWRPPPIQTPR
jgi:hypothetical protein